MSLFRRRHAQPHLDALGRCRCICKRCSIDLPDGGSVCYCRACKARLCGLHVGVPLAPRPAMFLEERA